MHRIQEMWERLSGTEDIIEEMDSLVKENIKSETYEAHNIKKIWNTVKIQNLWITEIKEGDKTRLNAQKYFQ